MNAEHLFKLIELKRQSTMKLFGIEAGIDSLDEFSLNMLINDEIGKLLAKKEFSDKLEAAKNRNKDRQIEILQQQIAAQKRKSDLDIEKLRNELSETKKKLSEAEELERSIEIASQLSSSSESTIQETELKEPSLNDGIETNSIEAASVEEAESKEKAKSFEELTPKCESNEKAKTAKD